MDGGVLQDDGEENAGEGDDRADRQVDAARQDDEGHADGGDAEKGVVGQKIADHARRQDVRILQRAERHRQTTKMTMVAISGRYLEFIVIALLALTTRLEDGRSDCTAATG